MNTSISKKQTSINMIANIVSYSANIIISFVLTPFLINTLGKDTYSFYPIANTIVNYMSILTNAMNSMASRFVTISLVKGKKEDANKYYSSTLAANLVMSGVLLIPMAIIVIFLDKFMEVPINSCASIKMLFALVFSSALVNISASVFGIATFAKNRIDLRSLRELVTAVLRLILFYLMYKFLPPSIVYVGMVTFVVAVVNILFQIGYTKVLLPEIKISRNKISLSHVKELFSSSCWNAVNSFGNNLLAGISIILANIFYGATEAGSYSIINTVPQLINGIIVMLTGIFYPVITYRYAENNKEELINEVKKSQALVGMFGCAVIAIFSALAKEFFGLWTPGESAGYLSLLSFLTIIPHFIISCMWSLTNLNVVMNKVKFPAICTLICGSANLLISYIVFKVSNIGLISLPLISSVLQCIWIGIFIPQYVCRNLKIKWNIFYPPVIKAIVCSVVTIIIISIIKQKFILDSWFKFIIFGGCAGCLSLILFGSVMLDSKVIKSKIVKRK